MVRPPPMSEMSGDLRLSIGCSYLLLVQYAGQPREEEERAQVSLRLTVRLNTGRSFAWSSTSAQK